VGAAGRDRHQPGGRALLAAVGSDRATMLALEPFAGVGATLVVPPALLVAVVLLRQRSAAAWVRSLWSHRRASARSRWPSRWSPRSAWW
jgi:hypothetical protein